jgi:hypothetical protein
LVAKRLESPVNQIVGEREIHGTGYMASNGVDRFNLTPIPLRRPAVDDSPSGREVTHELVGVGQCLRRPWHRRPVHRSFLHRAGRHLVWPAVEPTVEQRRRLTQDPQHPHEPRSPRPTVIVTSHNRLAIGNPCCTERCGERCRCGQWMSTDDRPGHTGEGIVEHDESRTWQVPLLEGRCRIATTHPCPDVNDRHVTEAAEQLVNVDDRSAKWHAVSLSGHLRIRRALSLEEHRHRADAVDQLMKKPSSAGPATPLTDSYTI